MEVLHIQQSAWKKNDETIWPGRVSAFTMSIKLIVLGCSKELYSPARAVGFMRFLFSVGLGWEWAKYDAYLLYL